jgi:hypothetical protein
LYADKKDDKKNANPIVSLPPLFFKILGLLKMNMKMKGLAQKSGNARNRGSW